MDGENENAEVPAIEEVAPAEIVAEEVKEEVAE